MAPEEKLCDQKFDLNAARRLGRKVVPGPSNRITLSAALSAPPLQFLWTGTRRVWRASYNLCDVTKRCFATTVLDSTVLWGLKSWSSSACTAGPHHTFGTACRFQAGSTVLVDGVFTEPWSKTQTTNRARLRQDGVAAKSAEGTKRRRYGVEAILFALETGGRWFELAQEWWSRFYASQSSEVRRSFRRGLPTTLHSSVACPIQAAL